MINRVQAGVLSDRYLDVFLGDWKGLGFLILQPVLVALCAGAVWSGTQPGPTLYFVLCFSTLFFGCVNACREIVKEGPIYRRERLVNLEIPAYVASKLWILGMLGFGQTLLFYGGIRYFLVLAGNPVLMVLALYLSLLAGTALGLAISAVVGSDVVALGLVPVAMVPQLIFSKLVLPAKSLEGPLAWMEQATLAKWSYRAMEEVTASPPDYGALAWAFGILLAAVVLLTTFAGVALKLKDGAHA
ncbi:MAG: ABC-type multidrug transport system, ATPase component [Cyanobacteria bacterium RYN_339]|nr:ABC-type multidrug transport system, ATPase component [Cyanobacteria bacterium RYN_339]